jgi:hypothetical protein
MVVPVIAWPGLAIGTDLGAVVGFALRLGGFIWWKLSPWG